MPNWDLQSVQVSLGDLRTAYEQWCARQRKHVENEVTFGRKMREMCSVERRQVRADGQRQYVYTLGDLVTAREAWDAKTGHPVEWPSLNCQ